MSRDEYSTLDEGLLEEESASWVPHEGDDCDFETVTTSSRKKVKGEKKPVDKGYHRVKLNIDGETVKVDLFSTNFTPGCKIRNAVTGYYYDDQFKVGSYTEDLLFKVCDATGSCDNRDPLILFFNDPEQWEKHFGVTCSEETKDRWRMKYDVAWKRINSL
jgi:hypothetical protein